VIENVNLVISTYQDPAMGDLRVSPEKGTVAFASGLQGWAFTPNQFAKRYSKKFNVDKVPPLPSPSSFHILTSSHQLTLFFFFFIVVVFNLMKS